MGFETAAIQSIRDNRSLQKKRATKLFGEASRQKSIQVPSPKKRTPVRLNQNKIAKAKRRYLIIHLFALLFILVVSALIVVYGFL